MIGVILKSIEAYTAFLAFRKQWYVPTQFIIDTRDIDNSLELIISDVPVEVKSPKLLIFGKDIHSFEDLGEYVTVTRALPFGAVHAVDIESLKGALPEVEFSDTFYQELESEFEDILFDSRDMEGLDIPTEGLTPEEIDRIKAKKISAILAQRAEEKRKQEEALRLEQERLAKEEADRKAAEEEALRKQREEELRLAKEEAERKAKEAQHQLELENIKRQYEAEQKQRELEAKKARLAEQEAQLALKKQEELLEARQRALESGQISLGTLNSSNLQAILNQNLTPPMIIGYDQEVSRTNGLKIGRRAVKKSTIYTIAGAQKDCGSSTIAYNFAYSLAKANPSVLLIDLDFIDNDLSTWFKVDKIYDCSIDVPFRGIPFDEYMNNLENSVVKVSLGKRRLSFLSCNKINDYTPESRLVLRSYDYTYLFKALLTHFDNIVVDIGCLSQPEEYQKKLLESSGCQSIVCYGASSTADINESIHNVYNVSGNYSAILSKAPSNINRIVIEKAIRRPILGIVTNSSSYHPGSLKLYEDDVELQKYWNEFLRIGGGQYVHI